MALSNSERQRRYRVRNRNNARLNMTISLEAGDDLKRLARHLEQSQRQVLEQLIQAAAADVVMDFDHAATDKEHQELLDAWLAPFEP